MRAPRVIQKAAFYRKLKQRRHFQRLAFFIETLPHPAPLRRPAWRASLNLATVEERRALRDVEKLRDSILRDKSPIENSTIAEICRISSKDSAWGTFLFHLTRTMQPSRCLELGTCLGVSAAYIGAALKVNGTGDLTTLEGLPGRAKAARENLCLLGLDQVGVVTGDFEETLPAFLETTPPIDLVFVDGHKDGGAMHRYFEAIRPKLARRNIIVFDDIRWSDDMRDGWRRIKAETCGYSFGPVGVCVDVR